MSSKMNDLHLPLTYFARSFLGRNQNLVDTITLDFLHRFRGGSRIFSQGGSSGKQCDKDDAGVSGEGTEGGLGGLPQENFEYEVL